ncbi:MAG: MoaD/ThiS family protein [Cytophagales bacterium]|nr:MAG: MoaD/ThiS family protein [Cytophagales bacterium]
MKLTIALFGITKEIIGGSSLAYELSEGNDVSSLLTSLYAHYPKLQHLKSLLVAVNSEYAEGEQILSENDEIALIPPVSGG